MALFFLFKKILKTFIYGIDYIKLWYYNRGTIRKEIKKVKENEKLLY